MWTPTWPIAVIQQLDRKARKIVVENEGNHPQGSTAIRNTSRKYGGKGIKSVENEYKNIKIKEVISLKALRQLYRWGEEKTKAEKRLLSRHTYLFIHDNQTTTKDKSNSVFLLNLNPVVLTTYYSHENMGNAAVLVTIAKQLCTVYVLCNL